MLNFTNIDKAFYNWVKDASSERVIWLNQNAPRPSRPYLTLFKSTILPIGHDFPSDVDDSTGFVKLGGIRQITLQIGHYGDNSIGVLENLWFSLRPEVQVYREALAAQGITLLNRLAIQDLSTLLDSQFEERAQMDLLFLLGSQVDSIDTSLIEIVNGHAIYKKATVIVKEEDFVVDVT